MKLEINEEEREWLEKVCHREERLAFIAANDKDLQKITILKNKLRELDPTFFSPTYQTKE